MMNMVMIFRKNKLPFSPSSFFAHLLFKSPTFSIQFRCVGYNMLQRRAIQSDIAFKFPINLIPMLLCLLFIFVYFFLAFKRALIEIVVYFMATQLSVQRALYSWCCCAARCLLLFYTLPTIIHSICIIILFLACSSPSLHCRFILWSVFVYSSVCFGVWICSQYI